MPVTGRRRLGLGLDHRWLLDVNRGLCGRYNHWRHRGIRIAGGVAIPGGKPVSRVTVGRVTIRRPVAVIRRIVRSSAVVTQAVTAQYSQSESQSGAVPMATVVAPVMVTSVVTSP